MTSSVRLVTNRLQPGGRASVIEASMNFVPHSLLAALHLMWTTTRLLNLSSVLTNAWNVEVLVAVSESAFRLAAEEMSRSKESPPSLRSVRSGRMCGRLASEPKMHSETSRSSSDLGSQLMSLHSHRGSWYSQQGRALIWRQNRQ